jgi:hypothetical protein
MLALGACFVLFGAFLRHRSGSSAAQSRHIAKRKAVERTETARIAANCKTTGLNDTPLSQATRLKDDKSDTTGLSSFLVVQEAFVESSSSDEGH